jgi:Family of unknown function (DUF5309)
MAILTGTNLTYAGAGISESFEDMIFDVSPIDTPLLSMCRRMKAVQTYHQWQTDALAAATSNRALEGDDPTFANLAAPTVLGNHCQISRKIGVISGTYDAVKKYGRKSEYAYQMMKAGRELKRDMEFSIVRNQESTTGAGAATARSTGGLEAMIASTDNNGNGVRATGSAAGSTAAFASNKWTAPTDGTATAFIKADLDTALGLAWTDGGDPSVIMTSAANKATLNGFSSVATRFVDVMKAEQASIVGAASLYVSDFGTHKVVLNRYMRSQAVLCIDPDQVAVAFLRPIQKEALAKTGDAEKFLILSEFAFMATNPNAHAKVFNLA